ncbi:hypothetical protein [Roseomonas elaeocarpi]|uniref:GxxExxY protein n=1 Tax=Roseomonas elaeocarpi TaxID=907779 RepID=A0ABV6JRG8_9PROT
MTRYTASHILDAARIAEVIGGSRIDLSNEKAAQAQIAEALTAAGISHEREVRLAPGDIPDFLAGGVAIEVKLRGNRKVEIYRQLERYCAHERVESILLVSNLAMSLPDTIGGKPARFVSLGRAWL